MKPTDIIEKSEKLRKAWFDKCLEQDSSWQALLEKTRPSNLGEKIWNK